jgi:hypothetical protein
MLTEIPKDPVILLSVVNTRLRDYHKTLDDLCGDMGIQRTVLIERLKEIEYEYDAESNQFI